jgi:hypothetical protein
LSPRFIRDTDQRSDVLAGELGTRLIGVCDAVGRPVDFVLVPGHARELAVSGVAAAPARRARTGCWPTWPPATRGEFRDAADAMEAIPMVPSQKGTKQQA